MGRPGRLVRGQFIARLCLSGSGSHPCHMSCAPCLEVPSSSMAQSAMRLTVPTGVVQVSWSASTRRRTDHGYTFTPSQTTTSLSHVLSSDSSTSVAIRMYCQAIGLTGIRTPTVTTSHYARSGQYRKMTTGTYRMENFYRQQKWLRKRLVPATTASWLVGTSTKSYASLIGRLCGSAMSPCSLRRLPGQAFFRSGELLGRYALPSRL
jgi:hypothetical protein